MSIGSNRFPEDDEPTTRIVNRGDGGFGDADTTEFLGGAAVGRAGPSQDAFFDGDEAETALAGGDTTVFDAQWGGGGGAATQKLDFNDEPMTRIVRQGSASAPEEQDPVSGWLVIVGGPGKGRFVSLGYGVNSIGRMKSERVCLDFGDEKISRNGHAMLTYDPRGRRFFIQHGGGKNLTYLGDVPLLTPTEIKTGNEFLVGDTRLRFVALCGADFDWDDS